MSDPQQNNAILSASTNLKDNLKKNSVVAISAVTFTTSLGLILAHLIGGVNGTSKPSLFFSIFGIFLLVIKLIENITKKNSTDNEKGIAIQNPLKGISTIFAITCLFGLAPIFLLYVMLFNVKINEIIYEGSTAPTGRVSTTEEKTKMAMYKSFIMIIYSVVLLCLLMITMLLIGGIKVAKMFKFIPLIFTIVSFVLGAIIYRFVTLQIKFYLTTG